MPDYQKTSCEQRIQATITNSTVNTASIQLNCAEQKSCKNCAKRGGCQSLSVYHWFFESKSINLTQLSGTPYHIGEALSVSFPDNLIQRAIVWLIGAPLLGFLLGIASAAYFGDLIGFASGISLAAVTFWFSKKHLQKRLKRAIKIRRS